MARLRLAKTGFRFNAIHSFPDDAGHDRFPHGHDYELTVMLEGDAQPAGLLFDMRALKPLVEREIIAPLDHANLDGLLPHASLEALSVWIWTRLRPHLPPHLRLGLTLWETRSIFIEYWE